MSHKILTMAAALVLMFASSVAADALSDVRELTKEKITIVINLLRQKDLSKEERNKRIVAAVDGVFDFESMAKLSLGKKHWVALDAKGQAEFSSVFTERLQESYLQKLDLYTDEEVEVAEAEQVKSRIHVLTRLVSKVDKKDMIYKFYKSGSGWKVYDVEILGVSVVQTYRSQFEGFLKNSSFADLMTKLRTTGEFAIPTGEKS